MFKSLVKTSILKKFSAVVNTNIKKGFKFKINLYTQKDTFHLKNNFGIDPNVPYESRLSSLFNNEADVKIS